MLIQFNGKYSCYNEHFYYLTNPNSSRMYHPNIQGAKSGRDVNYYIVKHYNYMDQGEFQENPTRAYIGEQRLVHVYTDALNAPDAATARRLIMVHDLVRYLSNLRNLSTNIDKHFDAGVEPYVSYFNKESFKILTVLSDQATQSVFFDLAARPFEIKSIVVEGDSQLGKTFQAYSIGLHN